MAPGCRGLPPEQDAYGQILLARFEGRGGQEIMEREDGLIYCGDPGDYFAPFRRWPPVERRAMRFVRGRVLDVGCGAGRVALHLQERGRQVLSIDESPLAVEVARRRGVEQAAVLPLAEVGPALGRFDTIVLMRNNFGLAGREERSSRLLRDLLAVTSEDARIVTDSVDPARIDDPDLEWVANRRLRMRVRWHRYVSPWFHYLMLAPPELERLVAGSGWHVARFLDDGSPRYVAILEKDERPVVRREASSATSRRRRRPRSAAAAPSAGSGTAHPRRR